MNIFIHWSLSTYDKICSVRSNTDQFRMNKHIYLGEGDIAED